ncbi:DUF308 domain-containing protein [Candidatus Dependentiae bacterium]|nr:DUF308 domain-containing protein [Candidatus Dependentiae bacterium]
MKYDGVAIKQLKENSSWYMLLGIGLILLGTLAIYYALYTTLFSILYLGALLTVLGVFEFVKSFKINKWDNFFLHFFLGILYIVGGLFAIFNPAINAIMLTLLMSIFFIVTGIAKIAFALGRNVPHKGLMLFNGTVALVLGGLILAQWPYSGFWVIGMFVGIDMILTGWSWIWLSMLAKKLRA